MRQACGAGVIIRLLQNFILFSLFYIRYRIFASHRSYYPLSQSVATPARPSLPWLLAWREWRCICNPQYYRAHALVFIWKGWVVGGWVEYQGGSVSIAPQVTHTSHILRNNHKIHNKANSCSTAYAF